MGQVSSTWLTQVTDSRLWPPPLTGDEQSFTTADPGPGQANRRYAAFLGWNEEIEEREVHQ